jgi:1,4-alpha-glucan branching enzyme
LRTGQAQYVSTLHLAVHWGKDWDTNFGRNFNVDISPVDPDGPSLSVLSPIPGAESEHSLAVEVQSDDAQRISLWLDGKELSSSSDKNLRHELDLTQIPFGSHDLVAVAERDSRLALRQVQFWRMPPIESAEVEGDPAMGATMNRDGTATFVLLAPGKRFVSVVGSFNNWNPRANPMKRASDGRWWTTFPIEPGTHTYQYSIDGALLLADPYSREVVWQNEAGIETHEPDNAKTVFSTEPDNFEWDDQGFRTPPLHDLIVYELYIPDLCPGEGFEGLTAKLDYIRDLGVTAIEPLPVNEFAGRHSWGYGTPRQLKTLINEAHKRGLAVIMDMVLNHMCWNSPLCALYGKDFDASPYFRLFLGENWGFPDCDQESPAFKQYVADMLQFWVREYHIDGFRYDATRWTGWKGYNDWGASWFAWAAKQADSNSIQIAEHLPPEIELINETEMDTGWDSNFRWRLREMLVNARLDREVFAEIMDPMKQGYLSAFGRMPYLESHDEERVMRELLEAGYSDEEAARRAETGLALVLTAPGVPMLYAGQEFGERTKKVVGWNPLNWTLLSNPRMQQLHKRFKDLTMLRRSHPALVTEEVQMLTVSESENIVDYERLGAGKRVVVATNFGRSPGHVEIPVNPGSQWRDILGHSEGKLEWSCFTATLPPGGAVVLSDL